MYGYGLLNVQVNYQPFCSTHEKTNLYWDFNALNNFHREYLESISPTNHVDEFAKPLFVIQGANDPRVLQVESDELVEEVRANNIPVEYVLFADEGHGFRKRVNRVTASEAYLSFLEQHL